MNIGEVKRMLRKADPSLTVYFGFASCVPTTVGSWRGIYAEPAIGWAPSGRNGDGVAPTVAALLEELERATDGRRYSGWKGGKYAYRDSDTLHVDNPGDCTNTEISRVELQDWRVILHTTYEE